jgi:hypothetical protein
VLIWRISVKRGTAPLEAARTVSGAVAS